MRGRNVPVFKSKHGRRTRLGDDGITLVEGVPDAQGPRGTGASGLHGAGHCRHDGRCGIGKLARRCERETKECDKDFFHERFSNQNVRQFAASDMVIRIQTNFNITLFPMGIQFSCVNNTRIVANLPKAPSSILAVVNGSVPRI